MTESTPEQHFARFRAHGDAAALAAVFDRLAPELLLVAAHVAGGAVAEDLLQATFLDAIRQKERWQAGTRLAPWLVGILANHAREHRRQLRRVPDPQRMALPEGESPIDAAAASEVVATVHAAVAALPLPYRQVLTLRLVHGFEQQQIAHALGLPLGTVKTQLHRGTALLRRALPAGLAGALVAMLSERGLAAVREVVVEKATAIAAATAATGAVTATVALTVGAGAMTMKQAMVAAAVMLALVGAWLAWGAWAPPSEPGAPPPLANAVTPAVVDTGAVAADARSDTNQRAAVTATGDKDAVATGIVRIHVAWSDDSAAADIGLYLRRDDNLTSGPAAMLVSDQDGNAQCTLPAGKLALSSDRGAEQEFSLAAGETKDVRLVLGAGVAVEGVVRDAQQRPVAFADVWLTARGAAWAAGRPVARSGADGAFRLRAVPKDQSLGALCAGHAPSALVDLDLLDAKVEPVHVDLVVGGDGAALHGTVRDARGAPIAAARLAVGSCDRLNDMRTSGSMVEHWSPRLATTDRDGNYAIEGLAPGVHPVEVWAEGKPYWRGECELAVGAAAQLDVTLLDAATVFGVVHGAAGEPLAGAIVRAFPNAVPEDFLQFGQYDFDSTFGHRATVADAAGRYRLHLVEPGTAHVYANAARGDSDRRAGEQSRPWAHAELAIEPGASAEWNPKVVPGPTIRGVVRYRDGAPMAGLFVSAQAAGQQRSQSVTTDRDGRFAFVCLRNQGYDLSVQYWSVPAGTPPLQAHDVWPDRGTVELTATFDAPKKLASGSVRGVVLDSGHRIATAGSLGVTLSLSDRSWNTGCELHGNAFTFTDVEPGRRQIVLLSGDDPIWYGPWFDLQPAEHKDLGTIVTEPGGSVHLRVDGGEGTEAVALTVWLQMTGAMHGRKVELGTRREATIDNLCAGTYSISAYPTGAAQAFANCTVAAEAVAEATLHLRAAVKRPLFVDYPATARLTRIHVHDATGTDYFDYRPEQVLARPYELPAIQLPLGDFTLAVELQGGGARQLTFAMRTLTADQPPVRLTVQ